MVQGAKETLGTDGTLPTVAGKIRHAARGEPADWRHLAMLWGDDCLFFISSLIHFPIGLLCDWFISSLIHFGRVSNLLG